MDLTGPHRTLFTPISAAITSTLFISTWLLYRWLLPKPIHGIPYNKNATKSIFGDIPEMMNHFETSKEVGNWFETNHERHDSPIIQLFINMFGNPLVVINDFGEAQV
jgi:hypothetical protein